MPDRRSQHTHGNAGTPSRPEDPKVSLEDIPPAACLIDRKLTIVHGNTRLCELLQADLDALIGRSFLSLVADPDHLLAYLNDVRPEACRPVTVEISAVSSTWVMLCAGRGSSAPGALRMITMARAVESPGPSAPKDRQLLAAHLERTPLGVIEWRLDRSVRYWNPAAERIFGYTIDEVRDVDSFPLIVDEVSRQHVDRVWAQLIVREGGESSVNTNITKDGRVIQCHWHNTPLLDDRGEVVGIASLVEDITERVEAQRKIGEARARLERIVSKLPVIVWALDDKMTPLMWNEHAELMLGYTASEIIGNPRFLETVHPDPKDLDKFVSTWESLGFGDFDEIQVPATCADGSIRQILLSNIAARCPIPGWHAWGVGLDVTDRDRAFKALRESERRFRDIIESVDLAGIVVDTACRVRYVNGFFLRLTGRDEDEVIGAPWARVLGEDVGCQLGDGCGTPESTQRLESTLTTKHGEARTIVWTRSMLIGGDGAPTGAYALGMDITDLRDAQEELSAHRDRLEELVQTRTRALAESERRLRDAERQSAMGHIAAGLSHDLGNVLLPVRCHLDTLRAAGLGGRQRDAVEAVVRGVELLEHLGEGLQVLGDSSDALAVARAPSGPPIDLNGWWDEVRTLLEGVVPGDVRFSASVEVDLPRVLVPWHLLTRAVMNLLVNAVEAVAGSETDTPGISLEIVHDLAAAEVDLKVRDNGPGIRPEIIRRVTDPFFTTKTRSLSTGLGLSIVNAVASMAGGRFGIGSDPCGGTAAVLRFPAIVPVADGDIPGIALAIRDDRFRGLCEQVITGLGGRVVPEKDARIVIETARTGDMVSVRTERFSGHRTILFHTSSGIGDITQALRDVIREERDHDR